ncbi:lipopolysaccharide biosynthesis protein [Dubosiella newyorkensis]|uniref:lipopolysaccharide biosynthesis protein n=1 Tax=Dubosiella newyorkensis TaxID=1862672 RepID=UPI001300E385|nr:lipopolysaccharide biosynthesis protein [Dubosiella newyorkensis]
MKNENVGKRLFITIIISGLAFLLSYIINFALTPFITNNIGAEGYGFVSLAKTFASYTMIAALAINSYSSRFITIEYHQKNYEKANNFLSTTLVSNFLLAFLTLLFAIFFINRITFFLKINLDIVSDVKYLFFLMFVNFGITIIGSSFSSSAYIANRLDLTGLFKLIGYILEAGALLFLYFKFKPKLYYISLALCIQNIFIFLTNLFITKKFTPKLKIMNISFSWNAAKLLVFNGIWNSLNSLGNTLNTGLDLIMSNLFLTDTAMGELAIAKTINTMFIGLFQLIAQPFQPLFLKSFADNNMDDLLNRFKLSMVCSGFLSSLAFAGFVALGRTYYQLWVPNQNSTLLWKLTLVGCFSGIFEGLVYPLYYIYTLKIKNKIPCIITMIGGIINVIFMYILLKFTNLGIYSIVLTTAVVMTVISLITNPIYMCYCLKIRWNYFYGVIGRSVLSCFIMTLIFILLSKIINPKNWIMLIISATLMTLVGGVIHFLLVCNTKEKSFFLYKIKFKKKL